MTDEQKQELRVRVAELCGWKHCMLVLDELMGFAPNHKQGMAIKHVPNYPEDLNAMHEAEKMLTKDQRVKFAQSLAWNSAKNFENGWALIHATATDRAIAFVKVMEGKE